MIDQELLADAVVSVFASPVQEAVATAASFVAHTNRLMAEYPDADDVNPVLREFVVGVAETALTLVADA